MRAKAIKFSSVVGASLVVMSDDDDMTLFQIAVFAVTLPDGKTLRDQSNEITAYLEKLINLNSTREDQPYAKSR